MSARLDPTERQRAWEQLAHERFDVLVVGGGVTGAGVALDAVTRGQRTALVEARDLAIGTSSRSSKLLHGGLRYLEQRHFDLVREALHERDLMLTRLAPHLARAIRFLYPLRHRVWERPYVEAGLTLYDTLGGNRSMPRHRYLSSAEALAVVPALRDDALVGAMQYGDAQVDDARHTMMVARTAAERGALVRTQTKVVELLRHGYTVVGARLLDVPTGATCEVRARVVIACTGVWTDEVLGLAGEKAPFHVRASKGIHFTVPRDRIASDSGLILRTDTSVLFVIPWDELWLIGTTDTDWHGSLDHPRAGSDDIDYLLDQLNRVLVTPLSRDDIVGIYAGLRPLLAGDSEDTSQLSREHAVSRHVPGLVSVAGGKYTTYRVMAKDAVDAAIPDLAHVGPCVTERTPIIGAEGYDALVADLDAVAARWGVDPARAERLLHRYGSLAPQVLAEGGGTLVSPVPGAEHYLDAELSYAVTHEGAMNLDDVLARRTRIRIETPDRGDQCAEHAARIIAPALGWDEATVAAQVQAYRDDIVRERREEDVLGG